uniref:Uncharacterized protein n=1 Tax=Arundo donax TaxID=35708 RepID=A0A0A8ZZA7_ARUDO
MPTLCSEGNYFRIMIISTQAHFLLLCITK